MDINFTLWSTNMSGGYKVIFELANGLVDRGHNVTITALGGDHSWFPLKARLNYVKPPWPIKLLSPILKVLLKRPARYYEALTLTQKLKLGFEPDLVKALSENTPECDINIATWFPTTFAVYRSDKGVPVYLCQDFDELARERGHYFTQMFHESLYLPFNIITISGWLKKWIKENYNKDSDVIVNGIDHNVFYPRKNIFKASNPSRREENISSDSSEGPKIMSIFRGLSYKGDQDLIDALKIVAKEFKNVTLVAVGKKEVLEKLLIKKDLNFDFITFSNASDDKMAELYSSSDIFAFPSHMEGFGLPPLEAMACETPVVTADCLGVRDYVKNGENAFMVPPKNPEVLAKAIINVLNDEEIQKKFKENGLKTASHHTWENAINSFESILIKAMNGN
ncbi:MAG: glycosyltransferase family 4 protein [Methanobacteriaceae archaeon]|nr:glycosyltransferase family 4 protein [Methanobacteriaceae archaeon]